ncbi:MAG: hypothetical protein AB7P31_14215 [Steroidobacteraceae bacterium]
MTAESKLPTEWLELMLGEIARKRGDADAARTEQARRDAEAGADGERPAG